MPRAIPCTGWPGQKPSAGDGGGSATQGLQGGALAPPQAQHPRAARGVVPSLQVGCFPPPQPRAADPSGRIPDAGSCSGRSPPGAAAPTGPDRTGSETYWSGGETFPPAAEAWQPADTRVAASNL